MSSDFVISINVLEASFSNSVDPDQTAYLFLSMDWIRDGSVTCSSIFITDFLIYQYYKKYISKRHTTK